jgi:ferredoxin
MKHRYLKNVATLQLDGDKCTGCGTCLDVCPQGVLEQASKRVRIQDIDLCMECGACALNCPHGAITVKTGVGCAAAVITGFLKGSEPTCDCSGGGCC